MSLIWMMTSDPLQHCLTAMCILITLVMHSLNKIMVDLSGITYTVHINSKLLIGCLFRFVVQKPLNVLIIYTYVLLKVSFKALGNFQDLNPNPHCHLKLLNYLIPVGKYMKRSAGSMCPQPLPLRVLF